MAHNIFGNRFYGHREEAWHGLGFVTNGDMTANEVFDKFGRYEFVRRPVEIELNGKMQETGDYAIVRTPTFEDKQERSFGYITKQYNIVQPSEVCNLFDDNVSEPVETMGVLGHGEKLFLTWRLPVVDINGDEIKMYGLVAIGYDGKYGANLHVTTIRAVCQNTLNIAVSESNENIGTGRVWSGRHNSKNVGRNLGIWMEHVQAQALQQADIVANLFKRLDEVRVEDDSIAKALFAKVYPMPDALPVNYPVKLINEKQAAIDAKIEQTERDRSLAYELFAGAGTAIRPTAFGVLNAVTEYENWAGIIKKPIEYSVMFGNRSANMNRALSVVTSFVRAGG